MDTCSYATRLKLNTYKNMENKDFAVFILTHGRPDNVKTLKALNKAGYTGLIYFIVDNEDKSINRYIENFGVDAVKVFDKKAMADSIDEGNNFDERRTITHARNACFDIARLLCLTYFIQLDDDYTAFDFRIADGAGSGIKPIKKIDDIFYNLLLFYKNTSCRSIAFAQGGDFIGGMKQKFIKGDAYPFNKRKCMNTFICSVDREFQFVGTFNEDVNTYTSTAVRGNIFLTIPVISITQTATQSQKRGITDMYNKFGTYVKAFSTVLMHPSGVRVSMMHSNHTRIHHKIKWINTVPLILNEKYKKL